MNGELFLPKYDQNCEIQEHKLTSEELNEKGKLPVQKDPNLGRYVDIKRINEDPILEFRLQMAAILTGVFILVIGLFWKDFFFEIYKSVQPKKTLTSNFLFAVICTFIFLFLIFGVNRYLIPKKCIEK